MRSGLWITAVAVGLLALSGCADQASESRASDAPSSKAQNAKGDPEKAPATGGPRSSSAPIFIAPTDPTTVHPTAPPPARLAKKRATVKAASASSASGRITMSEVESAIDAHIDEFAKCSTEPSATVALRAVVSPSGKVLEASSQRSSPDDPRLRDCVVAAFRALSFPASTGGAPAPLSFELAVGDG